MSMRTLLPLMVACGTTLAGCSLVYDPDDYVFHPPRCDHDLDGYTSADPTCGGNDCNDTDYHVHPGAVPTCDGTGPDDCDANEMQPELQAVFGVSSGTKVDFGHLPFFTDSSLPLPNTSGPVPALDVALAAFENGSGGQASVAFVAGAQDAGRAPRVYLFDYQLFDPFSRAIDDPGLGTPGAFTIDLVSATQARVIATDHAFTGVGTFLWYRDVDVGGNRPQPSVGSASTLSGTVAGTVVRDTVALAGAFDPIRQTARTPEMMWFERAPSASADRWARLPVSDTSGAAYRYADLAAPATVATDLHATTREHAFAFTDGVAQPRVISRLADSGSNSMPSGIVAPFLDYPASAASAVEPAFAVVGDTGSIPSTATYAVVYVDAQGDAHLARFTCTDSGSAGTIATACLTASEVSLAVPGVTTTAVAIAAGPGDDLVVALVGLDGTVGDRGVLLYYFRAANPMLPIPLAHQDAQGRPFLVRPEEGNGALFERLAMKVLDDPVGRTARLTVVLAGVSDYRTRTSPDVTVTGVVACIP